MPVARNWSSADAIGFYRLVISETPRVPGTGHDVPRRHERLRRDPRRLPPRTVRPGTLTIPDPERAAHEFGMLAYGEIREKALLGEAVTEADIVAVVDNAVRVFLLSYASGPLSHSDPTR